MLPGWITVCCFINVARMLNQVSQLTSSCSFFLGYQILRRRCVAYFGELYGVVENVCVPRWFSQRLPLKARVIKVGAIDALYRWVPLPQLHFSVGSTQRLALPNIRTRCRSCESVLVAAVKVPATRMSSRFAAEGDAIARCVQRTTYRPT